MNFKKGTFTANTSTGNQAITGVGFQPKGLMVWTNYLTATGFSDAQGQLFQIGMTDGTNQITCYARADDNTSPNDTDRERNITQLIHINSVAAATIRTATLVSFDSDGFTINWGTADAVAAIFHYIAIGGAEVDCAAVAMVCNTTGTGFNPTAAIPFIPKVGLIAHCTDPGDAGNFPAFGWFAKHENGTIGQGAFYTNVEDAQVTSDTWRYQRTNRCTNIASSGTGAVFNDFSYSQVGFIFDTFTPNAGIFLHMLLIGGVKGHAVSLLQPTSTGNQAITGAGFQPKGLLVASVGQTAQTTAQTECRASLGAGDGSSQGYAWVGNLDAANPSVAVGDHSTSNIVVMATPNATAGSSTVEAQASLASLDVDGFTLNWGTADATQREVITLVIGEEAAAGGGEHSAVF